MEVACRTAISLFVCPDCIAADMYNGSSDVNLNIRPFQNLKTNSS